MTKYYALIGPKLDGPALNSAMTACSIEPSIRQVPRLYVNRMAEPGHTGEQEVVVLPLQVFYGKQIFVHVF